MADGRSGLSLMVDAVDGRTLAATSSVIWHVICHGKARKSGKSGREARMERRRGMGDKPTLYIVVSGTSQCTCLTWLVLLLDGLT